MKKVCKSCQRELIDTTRNHCFDCISKHGKIDLAVGLTMKNVIELGLSNVDLAEFMVRVRTECLRVISFRTMIQDSKEAAQIDFKS